MRPIEQVLAECKTIEQLEVEHRLRDAEVIRLRAEMKQIHDALEPLWWAQRKLAAAPANLKQILRPGGN